MKKINGILLGLNGTLLIGNNPLDGAVALIDYLNLKNIPYIIFTNDSIKTPSDWSSYLKKNNLRISHSQIVTSATVLAEYFEEHISKKNKIHLVGEEGLRTALIEKGYDISNSYEFKEIVVVGRDTKFTVNKIKEACRLIHEGAKFFVTNPDRLEYYEGKISPGTGSLAMVIETTTQIGPVILGKPSAYSFKVATRKLNETENVIMIGDNIETDIIGAKSFGIKAGLLGTGLSKEISNLETEPDYFFENLNFFLKFLKNKLSHNSP